MSESCIERNTSFTCICACCAIPFQIILPRCVSPNNSEIEDDISNLHQDDSDNDNDRDVGEEMHRPGNSNPDKIHKTLPGQLEKQTSSSPLCSSSSPSQVTVNHEVEDRKPRLGHAENSEQKKKSQSTNQNVGSLDKSNGNNVQLNPDSNVRNKQMTSVEQKLNTHVNSLNYANTLQLSSSSFEKENYEDKDNDRNHLGTSKKLNKIRETLAYVFEYPCFVSEEGSSLFLKEPDDFTFCKKCNSTLTKLYEIFDEFTKLLNKEGRVLKLLQKIATMEDNGISDEPILPLLVYENDQSQSGEDDKSNIIKIHDDSDCENENLNLNFSQSVLLNQLRNALKYCTAEEMVAYQQLFGTQEQEQTIKNDTSKTKAKVKSSIKKPAKGRRKIDSEQLTLRHEVRKQKKKSIDSDADYTLKTSRRAKRKRQRIESDDDDDDDDDSNVVMPVDSDNEDILEPDDEDDPTFIPERDFDGREALSPESKTNTEPKKRRGRKPGYRKPKTQSQKSNRKTGADESENQNVEPSIEENNDVSTADGDSVGSESFSSPPPKKKRIRKLAKEYWIDKAKDDPNRTCDICGKVFLYARMMQHHKTTVHEGKKPFECEFCGRGFTQNFILKKHTCDYRLAGGDREYLKIARDEMLFKFSCDVCGKRFKERSALAVHQKNHTGESFKCNICEKTFRRADHLRTHVKIVHSDEKRFVCTTCGQRFKTSSNLRAHERKHANPDQKHLCNICGKSIKTLSQMGRHQKTHEDILPFECQICGKRFKMKDYLGQHLRKGKSCSSRINNSEEQLKDFDNPVQASTSTSFSMNTNSGSNSSQSFHQMSSYSQSQIQSSFSGSGSGQHSILASQMEFPFNLHAGDSSGLPHL